MFELNFTLRVMVSFTGAIFDRLDNVTKICYFESFLYRKQKKKKKKKNSGKILALTVDVSILNVLLDSIALHCTLTSYDSALILFSREGREKGAFHAVATLVYARLKLASLVILTFDRIYYS